MKVLYTGPYDDVVRDKLSNHEVLLGDSDEAIRSLLPEATVIVDASIKFRYTQEELSKAQNLELFVAVSTGTGHIDADYLASKQIPLLSLLGRKELLDITGTSELAWGLIMSLARRIPDAKDHVAQGKWDRTAFPGTMLNKKTLGIIGCGRLGSWMCRYGSAFGMECLGHDAHGASHLFTAYGGHLRTLDEVLTQSDVITLHVSLNDSIKNLIGPDQFDKMKAGVILVNTSQSCAIDESALLDNLRSRKVRAGLDVMSGEPNITSNPLYKYSLENDNLILTPHMGGYCPESVVAVLELSCSRILEHYGELDK